MLVVKLPKAESGRWGDLVGKKDQFKSDDLKKDADPQASLMNMMKKMYDEGDEETKRSMKKAWFEAQNKKDSAGGMGGMPGMPGMEGMGGMGGMPGLGGLGGMWGGMGGL